MKNNIASTEQYQNALQRIWELMQTQHFAGSPEYTELDMLVSMVEDYEDNTLEIFNSDTLLIKK